MTVLPINDSAFLSLENGIQLETYTNVDTEKVAIDVKISNECILDDTEGVYDRGPCVRCMEVIEKGMFGVYDFVQPLVHRSYKLVLLILYLAYFSFCMYYRFGDEGSIVLLVGTIMLVTHLLKKVFNSKVDTTRISLKIASVIASARIRKCRTVVRYGLYVVATAGLAFFLGFDVLKENPDNSQSLIGIAVLVFICFLLSKKPSRINWHPVFWGFIMQFVFATLTLRTEFGYSAFKWVGDLVQRLVEFSDAGSAFVLGDDFKSLGIGFTIIGIIVFFNCLIFLLTHWGVMEIVVVKLGNFLGLCLETGPIESVNAVANIFMGYAEVALLIRPYLAMLTKSEMCAVMTAGFASVAGGILGIFILLGAPANHLLTASVISAPAAMALAKVIYPETDHVDFSLQTSVKLRDDTDTSRTALSVCADGALMATKVLVPILANLFAFVSLIGMLDAMLNWFGKRAGVDGLSFEFICSFLLYPLSYVMGCVPEDCGRVGALIGIKLFATPLVGYAELGKMIKNRHALESYIAHGNGTWYWSGNDIILEAVNKTLTYGVITERSEVITTYAMCGFSAFVSIGIGIGSMTAMCPSRKQEIVEIVWTSFFAGNMASFATGAVAGIMFTNHEMGRSE